MTRERAFLMVVIVILALLFVGVSCHNDVPSPSIPLDDMLRVYSIAALMTDEEYVDFDETSPSEIDDLFYDEACPVLALLSVGTFDGSWISEYMEVDGKRYYVDEEPYINYCITPSTKDENPLFEFVVTDEEGESRTYEFKSIKFSVAFEAGGEKRTIDVDLSGTISEDPNGNMDVSIVLNGRSYSLLHFHDEGANGYIFTYEGYTYRHEHNFLPWTIDVEYEDREGSKSRICSECCFMECDTVPPTNPRHIALSGLNKKTYDGKTLDLSTDITFDGMESSTALLMYRLKSEDDSCYSPEAPKDVGDYMVKVFVKGDEHYLASTTMFEYSITPALIEISGTPSGFEPKVYNGEKQRWVVDCHVDGMPNQEAFEITVETDSKDVDEYRFFHNAQRWVSSGEISIKGAGDTKVENYDVVIKNLKVEIIPKALSGSKTDGIKVFDGSNKLEFSDLSWLKGIVDADRETLSLEVSTGNSNQYPGSYTIDSSDMTLRKRGEDSFKQKNYSLDSVNVTVRIVPKDVRFRDFGDTVLTPYLASKTGKRTFWLRDGVVVANGITYPATMELLGDMTENAEVSFNFSSVNLTTSAYSIGEEDFPKTLKVVEVSKTFDDFTSNSFNVSAKDYAYCSFQYEAGTGSVKIPVNGDGNGNIVPYLCNSNGEHFYLDYENGVITIDRGNYKPISEESGTCYLFFYSEIGAENLSLGLTP